MLVQGGTSSKAFGLINALEDTTSVVFRRGLGFTGRTHPDPGGSFEQEGKGPVRGVAAGRAVCARGPETPGGVHRAMAVGCKSSLRGDGRRSSSSIPHSIRRARLCLSAVRRSRRPIGPEPSTPRRSSYVPGLAMPFRVANVATSRRRELRETADLHGPVLRIRDAAAAPEQGRDLAHYYDAAMIASSGSAEPPGRYACSPHDAQSRRLPQHEAFEEAFRIAAAGPQGASPAVKRDYRAMQTYPRGAPSLEWIVSGFARGTR